MSQGAVCAAVEEGESMTVRVGDYVFGVAEAARLSGLSEDVIRERLGSGLSGAQVFCVGADDPSRQPLARNSLSVAERQKLVVSVMPWCKKAARQWLWALEQNGRGHEFEFEDLESEAYIAACHAAEFYREGMGATFLSYCRAWITGRFREVLDHRRRPAIKGHIDRLDLVPEQDDGSTPDVEYMSADARARLIVRMVANDGLSVDEVAAQLGIPVEDVRLNLRNVDEPNAEARQLMGCLSEKARTIVRMVAFDRLSPAQVAEQLGMKVKDVKLIIRNAAMQMELARDRKPAAPRAVDALAVMELTVEGHDVEELVAG